MKIHRFKYFFSVLFFVSVNPVTIAQEGFGTSNPNQNAIIDLTAVNKGVLMPRLALEATNSFKPLSTHVMGMTVYNTFTGGTLPNNVVSGYYYNDGLKWIKMGIGTIRNWNVQNTTIKANGVTQNIYQMGNVGIGTNNPTNRLHVYVDPAGTDHPVKIEKLLEATTNITSFKALLVKPTDGIIKWGEVSLPLGYLIKSILSQRFQVENFSATSTNNPAVINFTDTDTKVVDNGFVALSNSIFTVNADGVFDIYAIINLIADPNGTDYDTSGLNYMSVNLKLQKSTNKVIWTDIATSLTIYDVSSAVKGLTLTLSPLVTVVSLAKNDNLRLVVNRQNGAYITTDGYTTPEDKAATDIGIRTSGILNGVSNSKVFKIIKLK